MSIVLALHDATTNCTRDFATATVTLKSGVQLVGQLQKTNALLHIEGATIYMKTQTGWATFLVEEAAAVEVSR